MTGLPRGELFALALEGAWTLRWGSCLVQEAVYEGGFGTPKTVAGVRALPVSEGAVLLLTE